MGLGGGSWVVVDMYSFFMHAVQLLPQPFIGRLTIDHRFTELMLTWGGGEGEGITWIITQGASPTPPNTGGCRDC